VRTLTHGSGDLTHTHARCLEDRGRRALEHPAYIFLLSFSAREKHDTKHTPGHRKLLLVQLTVHGTDKTTQSNQGVHRVARVSA
jgi:hypothetical protein